jgi:fatty-acyl-CoA synthase
MQIRQHTDRVNPAVILHPSGQQVTYQQLETRANKLAHHLRAAGLRQGDTVAVVMENNEHIHAVMWAVRRCGMYYALLNTQLTGPEAAYIITNSDAAAIIGSAQHRDLLSAVANSLDGNLPATRMVSDADLPGWQRYPECVAAYPHTPVADESEGDLLQYSSGTTGRPKGIRRGLTGKAPAEAPIMLAPLLNAVGIDDRTVYLSPAPLYHTAPSYWSMSVQALGATVVVMEKFDPHEALEAIQRYRVTHAQFVPAMFVRMLKLPKEVRDAYDLSSLQRVVHAAAPCPVEIKHQMIQWWGPVIDEYYSSSEAVGASFITAADWLTHPGSVGKPLIGTPHIVDDDGTELPPGQPGTIYYDGGYSFTYLKDQAKTAQSRHPHGWITVGDIGYLDDDGYLYLTDRKHHMIISGGVNIYPQEAENLLISHPKVLDAAVFGIPDADMGQSVMAVVQTVNPADSDDALAAELLEWLRDQLAHYKCPKAIRFEPQLPRSDTGKLYKQQLIAKYS